MAKRSTSQMSEEEKASFLQKKRDSYHRNKYKKGVKEGVRRDPLEVIKTLAPEEINKREKRIEYMRKWHEAKAVKEGRVRQGPRLPIRYMENEKVDKRLRAMNLKACARYRERNKEKVRERSRKWAKENCANRHKEKYRKDLQYTIMYKLCSRISVGLRYVVKGKCPGSRTKKFLGCSYLELKNHIESLFTDGMSWEKFLAAEIHLDHIRPICSFNLTDPEQQNICFHYTNLQPLWAKDNLKKNGRLDWVQPVSGLTPSM